MNIFFLDRDLKKCVESYFDKHVVKMPVEYGQLLSTAKRFLETQEIHLINPETKIPLKLLKLPEETFSYNYETHQFELDEVIAYKSTHFNHPCSIWIRESKYHFEWLKDLSEFLSDEYSYRYNKEHKSSLLVHKMEVPRKFPSEKWLRDPPQAMPKEYQSNDVIESYRQYYIHCKQHLVNWKNRPMPYWWK